MIFKRIEIYNISNIWKNIHWNLHFWSLCLAVRQGLLCQLRNVDKFSLEKNKQKMNKGDGAVQSWKTLTKTMLVNNKAKYAILPDMLKIHRLSVSLSMLLKNCFV